MSINVGLLGYGMAGQVFHAPIIHCIEGLEIKSIRTSNADHAALANERYPNAKVSASSEEIIADPNIDLIVIATPNEYHYPLAKSALESGKHVVVDKPFTVTSEEADDLISIANEAGLLLSVFQNRRVVSDFRTVQHIIQSGRLGKIVEMEMHFDRFRNFFKGNWREEEVPGSGILYDLGSHLIDQSICLFGLPKFVTADLRNQRGGPANDYFDVRLDYDDLRVNVRSGMLIKIPGPVFKINGTQGTFVKYGLDVQEADLTAGLTPDTKSNWGEEPESQYGTLSIVENGTDIEETIKTEPGDYRIYYQNIYDCIANQAPLLVDPQDARNTIRIIELALLSHEQKRTVSFA